MYCQGYTTIRRELHSHISNMDAIYLSLSDNERTKYLLRVDNENTSKIIGSMCLQNVYKSSTICYN